MNKKLLDYIDRKINDCDPEPVEQLIYMIAKLSLISRPVAWMVKSLPGKDDIPCGTHQDAVETLNRSGDTSSYILPLYTVLKADVVNVNNSHAVQLLKGTFKTH